MDAFSTAACETGMQVLEGLPAKLAALEQAKAGLFPTAADKVRDEMAAQAAKASDPSVSNQAIIGIIDKVQLAVVDLNSDLQKLERMIRMSIPKAEDGNNWGVEVQLGVIKIVTDARAAMKATNDGLKEYFKERSEAVEKLAKSSETKTSEGTSETEATGGEKDTKETKKSKSTDTSTKTGTACADRTLHLAAIDTRWYFHLQDGYVAAIDGAGYAADSIAKNIQKIQHPRGNQGGDESGRPSYY
mmetsp:Transcript_51594/g.110617  ORF Transcript_51594/g.110617 Transcript_51594/m.110617 type:complete len:245 (-) Transcript_51594:105-839(-)|eukprot:CAMPEP_0204274326 /NCGR_PEP_ID=MMETSP0468-20130131/25126_1 /ASSEMBLY_ACC=CAM_ASM_000383 /TAXON_ID=2969 /ORGANISM="Oxyrrhis marina" /LENGTH=244 /DNA_ID=CAMNT_0051250523 /DNA_START=53 /DNA_END=787 /DNA_ORIENTATION=-